MTPEELYRSYNAAFVLDVYHFGLKEALRMQDEQDYLGEIIHELLDVDPEDRRPRKTRGTK